jgi:hypothetical protein
MSGNNVHAIRADERVARLYELVHYAPKLQLRVTLTDYNHITYRSSALPIWRREIL